MGLLANVVELFSADSGPITDSRSLAQYLDAQPSSLTGKSVTMESVMRVSAVSACLRLLGGGFGSLPQPVYRRLDEGGKERAVDDHRYPIFHDRTSRLQTSMEFRETAMTHLLLTGNFYAFKGMVRGRLESLETIAPGRVEIDSRSLSEIVYKVTPKDGGPAESFDASEILHVRGMSFDGVVGRSPIQDAKEQFGLAMAVEEMAGRVFSNRANHGIVLTAPEGVKTGDAAWKNIAESIQEHYTGLTNVWKTLLLEAGMEAKQVSMTLEDAQFLESRKYSVREIARIFGMQPHLIGDLEDATFDNITQQSLEHVIFTLRPWLVRWEQRINTDPEIGLANDGLFVEVLVDGLLRGDIETRTKALASQFQNGAVTLNEWRSIENRNPYPPEIGDVPMIQMNVSTIGKEPSQGPSQMFVQRKDGSWVPLQVQLQALDMKEEDIEELEAIAA